MVKQLDLSDWPWITLSTYQSRQGTRGGSSTFIMVWLKRFPFADAQCFMHSRKSLWLVVWQVGLSVWKGFVCLCTHTRTHHTWGCVHVCVRLGIYYMYLYALYIYVQYVGVSHTPAGLWSPESEDTDSEQRRLLAALEPWSMLGWKPACRRACLVRWSLLMKHLSHNGQLKRFSPVCVR